ncbi:MULTISPECIES: aromatic-ring-hydroxylating dioxygenase subunit beta [Agrobacterium]|uniref:aromatic-ring-hydroxylating dioxygenase subunit beta n=1 Tax=Agrobacterium TaxID=357 RepID=UPI0009BC1D16|nr:MULTISPECIES: aromatic-ring-hydroxylating dioxygenase subunit beta [Agrobacterium]WQE43273.1 aromatic-ring-hydroxylating dioxygenase subunit beta [Agrobacterium tumefaciens]CUX56667.1 Small subunit of phenylpropionate dioxygenase [Agrobacterium deltaense RV3]
MLTTHQKLRLSRSEAEDFLFQQVAYIDDRNYEPWLSLFTPDAIYWAPARPTDTDPELQQSFMYDDFPMMVARCERLLAFGTAGQQPITRSSHVVSNVRIGAPAPDEEEVVVHSRFHVTQFRRDVLKYYSGSYTHTLVGTDEGIKIRRQRVDLIDCDGVHDTILQLYL